MRGIPGIMKEAASRLRSLLFGENGQSINPDLEKYLWKVVPKSLDWEILEMDSLSEKDRFSVLAVSLYDVLLKRLENYPDAAEDDKKSAERLADMLIAPRHDDSLYAYLYKIWKGHYEELRRKQDPYKRFYHNIQQKIAGMKAEAGIFPLELRKGEGRRHYSTDPEPDRKNVYDADNPAFKELRLPDMPLDCFLRDFYARKQIRSHFVARMGAFFHNEIVAAWPSFGGRPSCIGIEAFSRWLAFNFPDLEGDLRQKTALDDVTEPASPQAEDFNLKEKNELELFEAYARKMWDCVPAKYQPVVLAILRGWRADEDKPVTDSAIAQSLGCSPQLFKYKKDKLLNPADVSSGILRNWWKPHLQDFIESLGEERLGDFMIYFYDYCKMNMAKQG